MRRLIVGLLVVSLSAVGSMVQAQDDSGEEECCRGGDSQPASKPGVGGGGSGGGRPSIHSWVVGVPGGGVQRPAGRPCSGWRPAADIAPDAQPVDAGTFTVHSDGVVAVLYYRDCDGTRQWVWIRQEPPEVIAVAALQDVASELLVAPEPQLSPVDRGIVNLETWLATSDRGPFTATASIPGLSVTVTATVESTVWDLGDGVVVVCEGAGVGWTPADGDRPAPCGHTFTRAVSRDEPHTITATTTWQITWQATNGVSGTAASITSDPAVVDYPIDEIQTIGTRG